MYAVEFQARIKDGTIQIPFQYHRQLGDQVRVILLAPPVVSTEPTDLIGQLLQSPLKVANFVPLSREEANERV